MERSRSQIRHYKPETNRNAPRHWPSPFRTHRYGMPVSYATLSSLARPHSFRYQLVSISLMRSALLTRSSAACRSGPWSRVSWVLRCPRCPAREAADALRCLEGSSGPLWPTELLRAAIMAGRAPSRQWSPGESGFRLSKTAQLKEEEIPDSLTLSHSSFPSLSLCVCVCVCDLFASLSYNLPACRGWNRIWLSSWSGCRAGRVGQGRR